MTDVTRRQFNFPFRRPARVEEPTSEEHYQVILSATFAEPCSDEHIEEAVAAAVEALVTDARNVAMGPVGGADLEARTLELEFTVTAVSPAVFHAKLGEVLRVLERHGFEYRGSSDSRLVREDELELAAH
jgi:hypothetical protein